MANVVIRVDLSSPVPAYRQVADAVRALLVGGAVPAGARLPPVRQVAADLDVHHNTVALAYRALADEGWLTLARGRGATVLARPTPPHPGRTAHDDWRQRLHHLVAQGVAAGLPRLTLAAALETAAKRVRG